jgi:hypothetical protein
MTDPTARQAESAATETEGPTAPEQADPIAEAKREAVEFKAPSVRFSTPGSMASQDLRATCSQSLTTCTVH